MTSGAPGAASLRSVLIALLGEAAPVPMPVLGDREWREIDRLAGLHRLRPMLHYRHQHNSEVPAAIRAEWREAARIAAFAALQMAGEIATTTALLGSAGFAPVALKGAWLAWHAYPRPELRPMRDIDLWLPPDQVIAGFELLCANGYAVADDPQLSLEDSVSLDKHLPPLHSPRGVCIELHHRLWEIDGRMDHAAPAGDEAAMRRRAIAHDGIAYLNPQDTLAHLIIHAVYDHRLDCGPLLLSDIAFLLTAATIDWDRFWRDAERGGWLRGAVLVLDMVRNHFPGLPLPAAPAGCAPPPGITAELMLQDPDTRQSAGVVATLRAGGPSAFLLRIFARRTNGERLAVARDLRGEGGFVAWAGTRLARTLRDLSRREVRTQARQLADLSRWLDG